MKTPGHWRALPQHTKNDKMDLQICFLAMKSCRDVITYQSCDIMTWQRESAHVNPKITFFNLAMLTYDLDLRTILDIIKINPHTKFLVCTTNGLTMRSLTNRHMDAQTGLNLYPCLLMWEGIKVLRSKVDHGTYRVQYHPQIWSVLSWLCWAVGMMGTVIPQ